MAGTLNEQEVDALMSAIREGGESGESAEGEANGKQVFPYDLTSQDRIIRGQMPTLDSINERIASLFATRLGARIRLPVEVRTNPASLIKFTDFRALLSGGTTVALLSLGSGQGSAVLVLEAGLAERLIAAAMGDKRASEIATTEESRQELTSVDRLVLGSLLSHFTSSMAEAWSKVMSFTPKVESFETDPRMVAIASPNDVVILCTLELAGSITGDVQLGIPFAVVEPVKKVLSSPSPPGGGANLRFAAALAEALLATPVKVHAELGTTKLSLGKFLKIKVGDIISLDTGEDAVLPAFVEGRPKLLVRPRTGPAGLVVVVEQGLQAQRPCAATSPKDAGLGTTRTQAAAAQAKASLADPNNSNSDATEFEVALADAERRIAGTKPSTTSQEAPHE